MDRGRPTKEAGLFSWVLVGIAELITVELRGEYFG